HRILYDGKLRDKAIEREVSMVTPYNEVAIDRAVKRWAIAEAQTACSDQNSPYQELMCKLVAGELRSTGEKQRVAEELSRRLREKLRQNRMPRSLVQVAYMRRELVEQAVEEVVRKITDALNMGSLKDLKDLVNIFGGEETLYNLRHSDKEVIFEFPGWQRGREMRYAVRHSLWGQIVAYRGVAYQVSTVQPQSQVTIDKWLGG
ncbi:hypothetical protein, partial [Infirmifilum sp.]|uniref:hypothetical protein n=1 Tax=Infirmifilum sp. TaxID=2856575 RepID=UPI003D148D29